MMQELGMDQVCRLIEDAFKAKNHDAVRHWLFPAIDQNPNNPKLHWYAGSLQYESGCRASALLHYQESVRLEPTSTVYANMGAALRQMNRIDEAKAALENAIELDETNANAYSNMVACHINEGVPGEGELWARKGLEHNPDHNRLKWNLALVLLEQGQFEEAWPLYDVGLGIERKKRDYGVPRWTPGDQGRLLVYGEQGIGDELMYHSLLHDVAKDYPDIVFDHHPRLGGLYASRPVDGVTYIPNRKGSEEDTLLQSGPVDFACGIADLCKAYRKYKAEFIRSWWEHGAYYKAKALYREQLEALADGRKIVGLALRGGIIKTMRQYRSPPVEAMYPVLDMPGVLFVCLEYDEATGFVQQVNERAGDLRMLNFPSITQHFDYHRTAELVESLDCVVTVCQSVAHLSAAMGVQTHVMVPSRPAWRYGMSGREWYLYPDAVLHRQEGDDWSPVVKSIKGVLS